MKSRTTTEFRKLFSGKNQIIVLDVERLENDEEYIIDRSLESKKLTFAI